MKRLLFVGAAVVAVVVAACQQEPTMPNSRPVARGRASFSKGGYDNSSPFGLSVGAFSHTNGGSPDFWDVTHAQVPALLSLFNEAGVKWIRLESQWGQEVNTGSPYTYNDSLSWPIQTLVSNGNDILVNITGFPYPLNDTLWANFVQHEVNTYGALGVRYWEIGNESEANFGGDSVALVHMIRVAARVIHNDAHYPGWVVGPATMYGNANWQSYFANVVGALGDDLDVASFHVYTDNPDGVGAALSEVRNHTGSLPIWITEENSQDLTPPCGTVAACEPVSTASILGALSRAQTTFAAAPLKIFVFSALPTTNAQGIIDRQPDLSFVRTKPFYAYKSVANPGGCASDPNCYQPVYAWWATSDVVYTLDTTDAARAGHSAASPLGYYLRPLIAGGGTNWIKLYRCSWTVAQVASQGPMHAVLDSGQVDSAGGYCALAGATSVSPDFAMGYASTVQRDGMVPLYRSFNQTASDYLATTNAGVHSGNSGSYADNGIALWVYPGTNQ